MGVIGLATGAGAAGGLETLFARMRAEEALRQHQEQLDQQRDYQSAELGLQGRNTAVAEAGSKRADTTASTANDFAKVKLNALKSITADDAGQPSADMPDFNNPKGRTMFQLAGLNANETYGAVPTDRPENLNPEESFYNSYAREHGLKSYHDIPSSKMADLRRQWAVEGHVSNPSQSSEPLVLVNDKDNPGQTILMPRSQAAGMQGPKPAAQKDRIAAYNSTLELIDEIEQLGDKTNWGGIGPVAGRLGRIGKEYLGVGSDDAEALRNKLDQLKAQASFQEGGKQFTGTERDMLNAFLANVNANPAAAKVRLKSFREAANRSLSSLGGNAAAPDNAGGDAYQQYLARTKAK